MKKAMTTAIFLILIFGAFTSLYIPTVQASPGVLISHYQLSPEILMPGDTAVLTIQVVNAESVATHTSTFVYGEETTTTVRTLGVEINNIWITSAQYGGKQIRATTNYPDVGYLTAGAGIEVSFKIVVDDNMSEGVYFPRVNVDVSSGTDVRFPLLIKVSNSTVDLEPKNVPSKISSNGPTDITITAINKRENTVDEVIITPRGENVSFAPESYYLGSLDAKTSQDVEFSVKPLGTEAENLSFDVSYKNGDNLHANALVMPVSFIETLDVSSIIKNFPVSITKGSSSRISIEVYNAKTERITGVLVTPVCDATVVPSQYFIGLMDPDDVYSASFEIYADNVDFGTYVIGFEVSFKQDNDYYETPVVSKSFKVVSGPGVSYQSTGRVTSTSGSNGISQVPDLQACLTSIVIIIVFIALALIVYVKWKKKRKA